MADRLDVLVRAADDAVRLRGTVMLQVPEDERSWCAVRASAQGHVEVLVGEPRRGWRVWRRPEGERWLALHDFTPVVDAWARPLRAGASARECAMARRGRADVDVGTPARRLAGVDVVDGRLLVATEPPGGGHEEVVLDRFELSGEGAREAAQRLCAQLRRDFGCGEADPLFISLIGVADPSGVVSP